MSEILKSLFGLGNPAVHPRTREQILEEENRRLKAAYKTLRLGVCEYNYGRKALRKSEFYVQGVKL